MKERLNVDAVRKLGQLPGRNNIDSLSADASGSARGAADSDGQGDAEENRALDRALILIHAKNSGIQSRPDVDRALQVAHETTLIDAYIDDFFSAVSVDEDDIGAAYARIKSKLGTTEYLLSVLTVPGEADALRLRNQLIQGASFGELAMRFSTDASRDSGGDIGWVAQGVLSDVARNEIDAIVKSGFSMPIRGSNGYHLLYVRDKRDIVAPSLDQIREQLIELARVDKFERHLRELRGAVRPVK